MAENKKSFILYADTIAIIDELPREIKGDLFQLIFDYVNDRNPEPKDILLKTAFTPIKLQLKRDLERWENTRGKRSDAGKKSAEKRQQMSTLVDCVEQTSTNSTVNVNVNDTVNVNDNVNVRKREGFAPPDRGDVVSLMQKYLDDFTAEGEADKFLDHYASKGWLVGRTKMKDWQASARGWVRRMNQYSGTQIPTKTKPYIGENQW